MTYASTDVWKQFSQFISEPYDPPDEPKRGGPHPHTYLAVAYAVVDSDRVVSQIRRDVAWLNDTGATYFRRLSFAISPGGYSETLPPLRTSAHASSTLQHRTRMPLCSPHC